METIVTNIASFFAILVAVAVPVVPTIFVEAVEDKKWHDLKPGVPKAFSVLSRGFLFYSIGLTTYMFGFTWIFSLGVALTAAAMYWLVFDIVMAIKLDKPWHYAGVTGWPQSLFKGSPAVYHITFKIFAFICAYILTV